MPNSQRRRSKSQQRIDEFLQRTRQGLETARDIALARIRGMGKREAGIREHADYHRAVSFRQGFETQDGVEYGWVADYAKVTYVQLHGVFLNLDEKADSIIRHLTGEP